LVDARLEANRKKAAAWRHRPAPIRASGRLAGSERSPDLANGLAARATRLLPHARSLDRRAPIPGPGKKRLFVSPLRL